MNFSRRIKKPLISKNESKVCKLKDIPLGGFFKLGDEVQDHPENRDRIWIRGATEIGHFIECLAWDDFMAYRFHPAIFSAYREVIPHKLEEE